MVHNIGRLALDQHRPTAFGEVLAYAAARNVSLYEAEQAVLGFTDPELGASLARYWGFPPELTDAIAHHHLAASAHKDPRSLAAYVSRARVFARSHGASDGVEAAVEPMAPPAEWQQAPIAVSLKTAGGIDGVRKRAEAFLEFAGG